MKDMKKMPDKKTKKRKNYAGTGSYIFTPTALDREIVSTMKAYDCKDEYIRPLIKNPNNKNKPVAIATFREAFKEELLYSKACLMQEAISLLRSGLRAEKWISIGMQAVPVPDWEMRWKAAMQAVRMSAKGVFEDKIVHAKNLTPEQLLKAVTGSLAQGKISTFEADAFIKVAQALIESRKADEVDTEKTINVHFDAETGSLLNQLKSAPKQEQ